MYNEEANITRLLNRLLEALEDSKLLYKILIYLDGCTDQTFSAIDFNFQPNNNIKVYSESERKGKVHALNYLTSKIDQTNYVLIIDSDVYFNLDSISKCTNTKDGTCIIMPRIEPLNGSKNNIFARWSLLTCKSYNELRITACKQNLLWFISGNFLFFPKNVFDAIYPIQISDIVNEDGYIGWIILKKGFHVQYLPEIIVWSEFPQNYKTFFRQKLRVRRGFSQLEKLGVPSLLLRKQIKKIIFRKIIKNREFDLLLLYLLDNLINLLATKISYNRKRAYLWSRIN